MKLIKSKKGAYAIAGALLVILLIIIVLTLYSPAKQTLVDIIGAATVKSP